MGVSLYWRRRFPRPALAGCFAIGLIGLWAALLGLMGAVAGVAFGTGFGWAESEAFLRPGGGTVSYPVLQIAGYVALSAVAALLASVVPARRAARLSVIEGLAAD